MAQKPPVSTLSAPAPSAAGWLSVSTRSVAALGRAGGGGRRLARHGALAADMAAGLRDSKTLSAAARTAAREVVADYGRVALGQASVAEIDRLNILRASLLAMARAVTALAAQLPRPPDWVLVDGNRLPDDLPCPGQAVIKGDQLSHSIAAAAIAAKCARDAEMARLDTLHPGYGWARNAGYGTAEHRAGLARLGVTPHHRRSFRPIRALLAGATTTG